MTHNAHTCVMHNSMVGFLQISESFKNMSESPGDWVLAFANCLYAYNGWNMLNLTAAEVRDPSKTIPYVNVQSNTESFGKKPK